MADSFDPYHVWLGIAPANQPPNHYRLLGIELFEQSGDAIDAAASRQSMTLRDFTSGEHGTLAENLLEEIKAARVCLLNPDEKSKYDEKLRSELTDKGVTLPEPLSKGTFKEASPGYHLWLGITPELQPPTHYRLLGLDPFESSEQVIEAGADRQSRYLREVAVGKQRKQSQSLLNEVSAARRCLLDPEKRRAYDDELRAKTEKPVDVPKDSVSEASVPLPEQKSNDAPKTDAAKDDSNKVAKSQTSDVETKPSASEVSGSSNAAGAPFPSLVEPTATTAPQPEKQSEVPRDDERPNKFTIIGGLVAAAILIGVGLFLWLPGPEKPEPRKTASAKSKTKDVSGEADNAKEPKAVVPGQLAHWTFDEKNPDWAANEVGPLVLALQGSPEFEAGPMGQAVKLDGKDDYLKLPQGAVVRDAGTIAFWVRRDSGDAGGNLILSQGEQPRFSIWVSAAGVLNVGVGPELTTNATTTVLAPKQWYHLALTWRPDSQAWLFCNAKKIAEIKDAGAFAVSENLSMGIDYKGVSIMASLDDVQCFDRALAADELVELVEGSSVTLEAPVFNQFDQLLAASKQPNNSAKPPAKPAAKPANNRAAARAAKKKADAAKAAAARKAAAAPKPPPFRTVKLPQIENNVSSKFWKNVNGEFSKLASSMPTARAGSRRLATLAAGSKERLGPKAFQQVRGLLIPPVDGSYKFHLKSVGAHKFTLGEGQGVFPRKQVKDGQSVELSGKQTYYFEFLHLDSTGQGSFSVGWTLPNGVKESPIPGKRVAWTPFLLNFTGMHRTKLQSSDNLTLEPVEESDLILAAGDSRGESTVTLEYQSDITTFTAFQLSAHKNEELLPNGPGLGARGMFSVNGLTLEYMEPGSEKFVPVALTAPVARVGVPDGLVDDNPSTKWTVRESDVDSVSAILVPEKRLTVLPQTKLRVTLHQDVPLGLFSFRGTASNAVSKVSSLRKTIEQDNAPYALYVNTGGGNWKDSEGRVWKKSKAYTQGSWGHQGGASAATSAGNGAPRILESALSGISAFRADVPNGKYDVTLFFRAHGVRKAGDRVFSVQVESLPAVPMDLFQVTGGGKQTFAPSTEVVVKDGRLDIVFRKIQGPPPILNAVSITE